MLFIKPVLSSASMLYAVAIGSVVIVVPVAIVRILSSFGLLKNISPYISRLYFINSIPVMYEKERFRSIKKRIKQSRRAITWTNISELIGDIGKHDSINYVNRRSIDDGYFREVYSTFGDPHMYIVLSNTGSPASEMISVFTGKMYNHVSLSFDEDLATIASYNGGEKVDHPGLNRETLRNFTKKSDSSILVYAIPATIEQKVAIAEKIRRINSEGSSYNVLGLIVKRSLKPNIMYCSQFVYSMLEHAGLEYFAKRPASVDPTDFVELDARSTLEYRYELRLNGTTLERFCRPCGEEARAAPSLRP
jgi:hypothetical protein